MTVETRRLLRHEGAHQLFDAYGIHSERGVEHLWLIEGLASYCENRQLGDRPTQAIADIQDAMSRRRLLRLRELVNYGDPTGFGGLVPSGEVNLVYAQSALIVDYLMRPENRDAFFAYIRMIRDPASRPTLESRSRMALLASALETTPQALETAIFAQVPSLY